MQWTYKMSSPTKTQIVELTWLCVCLLQWACPEHAFNWSISIRSFNSPSDVKSFLSKNATIDIITLVVSLNSLILHYATELMNKQHQLQDCSDQAWERESHAFSRQSNLTPGHNKINQGGTRRLTNSCFLMQKKNLLSTKPAWFQSTRPFLPSFHIWMACRKSRPARWSKHRHRPSMMGEFWSLGKNAKFVCPNRRQAQKERILA
jgi:hypothetical protein